MTAERKLMWMPAEYEDEVVPPPRASPNDWITRRDDGTPALATRDPLADEDEPERDLIEGEIVKFGWYEDYGTRELTFHRSDNGWTWTLDNDAPMAHHSAQLTVAQVCNWESAMPTLEDFAECYVDNGVDDGEQITITFYGWSASPTPFVFRDGAFHEAQETSE